MPILASRLSIAGPMRAAQAIARSCSAKVPAMELPTAPGAAIEPPRAHLLLVGCHTMNLLALATGALAAALAAVAGVKRRAILMVEGWFWEVGSGCVG